MLLGRGNHGGAIHKMSAEHLVFDLDLVRRQQEGVVGAEQQRLHGVRMRVEQTGCFEASYTVSLAQTGHLRGVDRKRSRYLQVCLVLSTAACQDYWFWVYDRCKVHFTSIYLRPTCLDRATIITRHSHPPARVVVVVYVDAEPSGGHPLRMRRHSNSRGKPALRSLGALYSRAVSARGRGAGHRQLPAAQRSLHGLGR